MSPMKSSTFFVMRLRTYVQDERSILLIVYLRNPRLFMKRATCGVVGQTIRSATPLVDLTLTESKSYVPPHMLVMKYNYGSQERTKVCADKDDLEILLGFSSIQWA